MPDSPALRTYEAWDSIYQFLCRDRLDWRLNHTAFGDSMPEVENAYDLDQQGGPGHAPYTWRPTMHLNSTHGLRAVAMMDGRLIYDLGRLKGGKFSEHLLTLAPDGSFRLGQEFDSDMTWRWGPYDHVTSLTKFLRHGYDLRNEYGQGRKVWYISDSTNPYQFLHVRDWRKPIPYFRLRAGLRSGTWFQAAFRDGFWRAEVIPGQDLWITRKEHLDDEYARADARYERYRQKYLREHGLPDEKRPLSNKEIEFVDHISQHVNLYEPGEARLLRDAAPAC